MIDALYKMPNGIGRVIVEESDDILATLLERFCPLVELHDYKVFFKIVCQNISRMYWSVLKST